jgi:hypothetical protein
MTFQDQHQAYADAARQTEANKRADALAQPAAVRQADADKQEANRDPITGAPGAHPVGTGVGAALGGAAAGAVTGTVAGPVGTLIGAAVGAIAGGLAGKGVAEAIDPTQEEAYWREHHATRPYYDSAFGYDDYAPAYGYGLSAWQRNPGGNFDALEPELERRWNDARGTSRLDWPRARNATRDAWSRLSDTVERATPGDSDRDGK